ncbi:hypothetical protein [Streptococcus intermedius]|nr:hypothetical protein [Streptococcus intermedius]
MIQISWLEKFLFFLLAVLLILFWARYMAPKSPHALKNGNTSLLRHRFLF